MDGYIALLVGKSCSLEQMISRVFGKDDLGQYGLNWLKNNFLGDILQDRQVILDLDRKLVKNNDSFQQYIGKTVMTVRTFLKKSSESFVITKNSQIICK